MDGIESVGNRVDGVLRLEEHGLSLEWNETQTIQEVSLARVGTEVRELPLEWLDLPMERVTGAWLVGGWWRPRLEVRLLSSEDLAGVPGARGVTLPLRIRRRDRELARVIAAAIVAIVSARQNSAI